MENVTNYALILGVSSGFGKATALKLAEEGYNIFGIHLDRGKAMDQVRELKKELRSKGVKVKFFNANAASEAKRIEIITHIKKEFKEHECPCIKVFMHSLAFGSIGPLFSRDNIDKQVGQKRIEMTMNVMANSLVYWVQDLFNEGMFSEYSRIYAMTSYGSEKAMKNYGAVAAAKAALEAYVRQIAVELGPHKIIANALMAGFTATPASSIIPGFENSLAKAQSVNPQGRVTLPEDVANTISLLSDDRANWISGQTIPVDGGESIVNIVE